VAIPLLTLACGGIREGEHDPSPEGPTEEEVTIGSIVLPAGEPPPPDVPAGRLTVDMTDHERGVICAWGERIVESRAPACTPDAPVFHHPDLFWICQAFPIWDACTVTFEMLAACVADTYGLCMPVDSLPNSCERIACDAGDTE
jgi:hypothetical protein